MFVAKPRRHEPRRALPHVLAILLLLSAGLALVPFQQTIAHAAPATTLTPPAPLQLISTNLPAYTNDLNAYDPTLADDSDYGTIWDSVDTPSSTRPIWLALDLSTVPTVQRQQVILAWFNDSGDYLPYSNSVFYNLPSTYTIDANTAAGGTSVPPGSGWVTLLSVTGNKTNAREHSLTLTGYNWVRMTITATKGSSGNTSAAFNLDIYNASAGNVDNWLFLGDSITQEGMTQGNIAGGSWTGGDYAQLVHAAAPTYYPLQIDGGMGGWTSDTGAQNITALMNGFTGHFVGLAFGTNDANEPYLLSTSQIQTFYANMLTMIDAVQAAGRIAIVPYVPWGCNGDLGQNAQALNNYVNAHLATDRPDAVRGPDLWTPFSQNHSWISSDCIHPTYSAPSGQLNGFEHYQRVWEQWALATVYQPVMAPGVTLAPTSLSFGNQNVGTTSAAQVATLTNSGTAALTITSVSLSGANAGDFAQTNTCPLSPNTLAAGANCIISVTFTPSANGGRSASVTVSDNASGSPQSVALSGTGVTPAPAVTLNPTSLSFGNQDVGTTSAAKSVTLTNSGTAALTISSIAVSGINAGDFAQTNSCPLSPSTLAAGANCTMSVTFSPSATGSRSASVTISDNATGSPQTVALLGTGTVSAPAMTLNPTSLSFGNQNVGTTSAAKTVTLTNSGTAALTITSISVTGTNAGDFAQTNTCPISPSTLAAGANCTISVTFTPSASGARSGAVSMSDNAAGSPQSVALSGTGVVPAPAITLNPTSINFGDQLLATTSPAQTVTLTNSGTAALTISSIAISGTNAADFAQTNTCPLSPNTLAAGANCTLSVTFTPSATGGRSASITIADNAAGSPQSIALSGNGVNSTPGVMMIGSTSANGNFGAGVRLTIPATTQAGDLLIAVAGTNGSPSSWTTPTGWTAGAGSGHPDGQGLNWWWKIATSADAGATVTLKASSYADGGGVILDYRGASATPIQAVSAMTTNDNFGDGRVTSAQFAGASWSGSANVVSLLLMSWQPANATVTWPTGYSLQATANDGYGFVTVGANLTTQSVSSLPAQVATLSASQAVVPTLQLAIRVGP